MISIMLRRPQKSPGPSASPEASRSVATRTEIGPVPHRDRSSSAPRSVALRIEIGRTPARNRSSSASRSVQFRAEIGPAGPRMPVVETDGAAITELERTFAM